MPPVDAALQTIVGHPVLYINILLSLVLLPFFAYLGLIVSAALWGRRRRDVMPVRATRFLFVIPAHDEEENITATVESCRRVAYDPALYRVVVIADNCTDRTAAAARAAGAETIERTDSQRRSKGHALEYFFAQRPSVADEADAVVVIDADTIVDPWILTAFAEALAEGKDWVQCYYTVRNPDASWRTRMMTYAFSLFNGVWLLGQDRIGLAVGLKGNGMCLSTRGLARFPWRAYGLTEDLEFSWTLRVAGERIHFLPETRVYGAMLSQGGPAAAAQRLRWEAGRKAQRRLFLGLLLRSHRIGLVMKLLYLVDLVFPPLVTLLLGLLVVLSLDLLAVLDLLGTSPWLLTIHSLMAVVLTCYALSPLLVLDLPVRYLASLVVLPYYAVWKLRTTAGRNPTTWVRTPREPMPRGVSGEAHSPPPQNDQALHESVDKDSPGESLRQGASRKRAFSGIFFE
jgi:cellulose synthase/poly-beta-1,6-N-acetylglucosamine synthase-like glycosyltransferase